MRTVEIPEPIYEEVVSRAAAAGQSVDAFVLDVLVDRFADADDYARLTPEQIEIVARADADIDAGNFYTSEEVRDHFARKREGRTQSGVA